LASYKFALQKYLLKQRTRSSPLILYQGINNQSHPLHVGTRLFVPGNELSPAYRNLLRYFSLATQYQATVLHARRKNSLDETLAGRGEASQWYGRLGFRSNIKTIGRAK
jgi:hypothetical protein